MEIIKLLSKTSDYFSILQYSVTNIQYGYHCNLWSLDSKRLIYSVSSFHFVNGVWNAERLLWQLSVNNNHLGFCLYASQSKFCFICWVVNPGKSNFWHARCDSWSLEIFLPRMDNATCFKHVIFTYMLTFRGRMSDQIRKTRQSFS